MAGVDLLPSAYLNFRGTKAWVDQPCPAGVGKWQSNNCPPLWRPKWLFSCPLTSASVLHAEWGRRSFKKGWYLPPQADEHSSVVFPLWLPGRENTSATISVFTLTYFITLKIISLQKQLGHYLEASWWFERPFRRAKLDSITAVLLIQSKIVFTVKYLNEGRDAFCQPPYGLSN